MKKILFALIPILLAVIILLEAFNASGSVYSKDGFYFDTIITISAYNTNEKQAIKAIDDCFNLAETFEEYFSASIENSDISRINKAAPQPVTVHPETIELLKAGIEYAKISDGAFDITLGKITSLWDFSGESHIPEKSELEKYLPYVDYKNIKIDGDNVALKSENAAIDLGGIAKGYIADKMKESLVNNGVKSAIINLGGNVVTIGKKSATKEFTVGIQNPDEEISLPINTLSLSDKSLVTSGTYQRYFEKDGKRYHHILDKNTGMPMENGLVSVSIISEKSVDGDALSTTCFLLGEEKAIELINSLPDTEAMFIRTDGGTSYTGGFSRYFKD